MIKRIIRQETVIRETQFGFMPRRSTIKAIHVLRRLMEKYKERKKDLHMVFIDLDKMYNSIPRRVIWDSLKARVFLQCTLRLYGICMIEFRLTFK